MVVDHTFKILNYLFSKISFQRKYILVVQDIECECIFVIIQKVHTKYEMKIISAYNIYNLTLI